MADHTGRYVGRQARAQASALQRGDDRVAHAARGHGRPAVLGDVRGARAVGDAAIDGLFDGGGFALEAQRMPQQQRDAEDRADGIGDALAGDVRRRAVDRLVQAALAVADAKPRATRPASSRAWRLRR